MNKTLSVPSDRPPKSIFQDMSREHLKKYYLSIRGVEIFYRAFIYPLHRMKYGLSFAFQMNNKFGRLKVK